MPKERKYVDMNITDIQPRDPDKQTIGNSQGGVEFLAEKKKKEDDQKNIGNEVSEMSSNDKSQVLTIDIETNSPLNIDTLKSFCTESDLEQTHFCRTLDTTLDEFCSKKKGGKKSKRTRKRVRKTKKTKNKKTKRRARRTRKRS